MVNYKPDQGLGVCPFVPNTSQYKDNNNCRSSITLNLGLSVYSKWLNIYTRMCESWRILCLAVKYTNVFFGPSSLTTGRIFSFESAMSHTADVSR